MASYRFLTTWLLDAPREQVWEEIKTSERWPVWWRGVERAQKLEEGDENDVGAVFAYLWRSRLPYPVAFTARTTRVERCHLIEASAWGELEGTGTWRLYEAPLGTAATDDWNVRTTHPWMNALAPVGRAVFEWNHNAIMRWGAEGLARRLGVPLVAAS